VSKCITGRRNQSLLIKLVSEDENPQERLAEIKNKENAEDPPENEPANGTLTCPRTWPERTILIERWSLALPPAAAPTAVILKDQPTDQINAVQLQDLLGKTIYVNWPYLKEALVLEPAANSLSSPVPYHHQHNSLGARHFRRDVSHQPRPGCCQTYTRPYRDSILATCKPLTVNRMQGDAAAWIKECKYQKNHYKAKKGMDIGQPKVLCPLGAFVVLALRFSCG